MHIQLFSFFENLGSLTASSQDAFCFFFTPRQFLKWKPWFSNLAVDIHRQRLENPKAKRSFRFPVVFNPWQVSSRPLLVCKGLLLQVLASHSNVVSSSIRPKALLWAFQAGCVFARRKPPTRASEGHSLADFKNGLISSIDFCAIFKAHIRNIKCLQCYYVLTTFNKKACGFFLLLRNSFPFWETLPYLRVH